MRVIGGHDRGRRLRAPRGLGTRPTADRVRVTLFDVLGPAVAGALVNKMVTCLRIADPPNAKESTEVILNCMFPGLPGILPYTLSANNLSMAARC